MQPVPEDCDISEFHDAAQLEKILLMPNGRKFSMKDESLLISIGEQHLMNTLGKTNSTYKRQRPSPTTLDQSNQSFAVNNNNNPLLNSVVMAEDENLI